MSKDQERKSAHLETFPLGAKIINSGVAGIVGVTLTFPLDLVKTRLQNQETLPDNTKMYRGIVDCFKKTIRSEGYFGMYRGSAINLMFITPEKAIKLTVNDYIRYILTTADGKLSMYSQILAGAGAGLSQIIVTTPMELIKIQMQNAGVIATKGKADGKIVERHTTSWQLITKILRQYGVFGFYRGIGPTALRDVGFSCIFFPLFAVLNDLGPRRVDGEAIFWCSFASGLVSGACSALLATPLDCIKTRLQTIDHAPGARKYNGILDCTRKMYTYEGPLSFFKGGLCRIMYIAPLFAIVQMVYYANIGEKIGVLFFPK